jgi:hypothetical protein
MIRNFYIYLTGFNYSVFFQEMLQRYLVDIEKRRNYEFFSVANLL